MATDTAHCHRAANEQSGDECVSVARLGAEYRERYWLYRDDHCCLCHIWPIHEPKSKKKIKYEFQQLAQLAKTART